LLLSAVLQDPTGDGAAANICTIKNYIGFLEDLNNTGCDIQKLIRGTSRLLHIATDSLVSNTGEMPDSDVEVRLTLFQTQE
jgi:hypothetical protein